MASSLVLGTWFLALDHVSCCPSWVTCSVLDLGWNLRILGSCACILLLGLGWLQLGTLHTCHAVHLTFGSSIHGYRSVMGSGTAHLCTWTLQRCCWFLTSWSLGVDPDVLTFRISERVCCSSILMAWERCEVDVPPSVLEDGYLYSVSSKLVRPSPFLRLR